MLLDIFFDFFKAMPQQTHRLEKIKLLIDNNLLVKYTINSTVTDVMKISSNQTNQASLEVQKIQ